MSEKNRPTLLLVDGLSMAFRAFFGLPVENFATSTGVPTNAVYGFTTMLATLMKDHAPTHVAVAFDLPGGTFRTEELPSYKGTRDATPPEFEPQVPLIREMLDALGVSAVDKERYEADDLLATYARKGREAGMRVLVVSGDRDTIQLVTEDVTLLYPRKGVSDLVHFTPEAVREKYGVDPHQYPELAALVGETSDNLPGVPGVGPKTAAKWIGAYGGLEQILAQADDVPGKAGQSLRDHLDQVRTNRRLNRLLDDLDVEATLESLEYEGADAAAIHQVCDALQFRTLRDRLMPFVAGDSTESVPDAPAEVEVVTAGAVAAVTALTGAVTVHVEGRIGADADAWALGVSQEDAAWGIDLSSLSADDERALGAWLADPAVTVTAHAAKDAWHALQARGFDLGGIEGDTQIAAFLVNADQRGFDLDAVLQRYLGIAPSGGSDAGELDLGLGDSAAEAAGRTAAHVATLAGELHAEVERRGMTELYRTLEIPLVAVLARMEHAGMAVDSQTMGERREAAQSRADAAAAAAYESIGGDQVNLGSPKQLQEVLFERLGMPKTKKIKTGYTTDAASLADLQEKNPHPFLEALLAHRDAAKLGQIIDTLAQAVRADGRIHTTFSQVVASTGRLSSKDPNLQNIPIRTEEGHRIREAFVVGEGYATLLTADYSQIEMRIMAHLSGDEGLIEAFKAGEDLHCFVGARVFGVEPADVSPEMRSKVKAMSYGLAYGLSSFGLARQLSLSVGEAQKLMDDYFARFGGVRDYLHSVVEQARQVGYTETIMGRRRYIPDLTSTNRQRRDIAERVALNAPIQGSAADIIKRAMLGVDADLAAQGLASRQLLQVHDELVIEVAPGEEDAVEAILVDQMHGAADLSVPLDVNVGRGSDWRTAGH
ncbi:DNA polymerase I [Demequina sp. NBRC 110057]|uniref:DNA polymerase I n=1 Tax=Demequina sp. NBRC 110057 TaxID=1570346 RepID=UPI0009FFB6F7|nr:DNA polymerase I [Demequina sp. NBRC 110057]